MNWKWFGRKWSGPNLRYCPNICLKGLRKFNGNLIRRNQTRIFRKQATKREVKKTKTERYNSRKERNR
jgi:hypothetical protein